MESWPGLKHGEGEGEEEEREFKIIGSPQLHAFFFSIPVSLTLKLEGSKVLDVQDPSPLQGNSEETPGAMTAPRVLQHPASGKCSSCGGVLWCGGGVPGASVPPSQLDDWIASPGVCPRIQKEGLLSDGP